MRNTPPSAVELKVRLRQLQQQRQQKNSLCGVVQPTFLKKLWDNLVSAFKFLFGKSTVEYLGHVAKIGTFVLAIVAAGYFGLTDKVQELVRKQQENEQMLQIKEKEISQAVMNLSETKAVLVNTNRKVAEGEEKIRQSNLKYLKQRLTSQCHIWLDVPTSYIRGQLMEGERGGLLDTVTNCLDAEYKQALDPIYQQKVMPQILAMQRVFKEKGKPIVSNANESARKITENMRTVSKENVTVLMSSRTKILWEATMRLAMLLDEEVDKLKL